VTSVIFSGDPVAPQTLTRAATAQNYFPEWIITGSALTDTAAFARTYDQRQWAHAFGVSFGAARTGVTGAISLYEWYFGHKPPDLTAAAVSVIDASLFFPVIQGVGPDLTAQNFQKALFAGAPTPTRSRNPRCRGAITGSGRGPTTAARTTPRRSGGTRRSQDPMSWAARARGSTSTSTEGSATCRVSGRPGRPRLSRRRGRWRSTPSPHQASGHPATRRLRHGQLSRDRAGSSDPAR
jgi:hypothetical protein